MSPPPTRTEVKFYTFEEFLVKANEDGATAADYITNMVRINDALSWSHKAGGRIH